MSNFTKINCPSCKGTGKRKLGKPLQEVLDYLKERGRLSNGKLWHCLNNPANPKVSVTAIHRRTERLLAMRLIKKVRNSEPMEFEGV